MLRGTMMIRGCVDLGDEGVALYQSHCELLCPES